MSNNSNNAMDVPTREQPDTGGGLRRSREEWEEFVFIYQRAEKAAVRIQQTFRNNRQQQQQSTKSSSTGSSSTTSDTEKDGDDSTVLHANGDDNGSDVGSDADGNNDKEHLFTLIFLAVITLLTSVRGYVEKIANWMSQCLTCLTKCCRGGDGDIGNAAQQSTKGVSTR